MNFRDEINDKFGRFFRPNIKYAGSPSKFICESLPRLKKKGTPDGLRQSGACKPGEFICEALPRTRPKEHSQWLTPMGSR